MEEAVKVINVNITKEGGYIDFSDQVSVPADGWWHRYYDPDTKFYIKLSATQHESILHKLAEYEHIPDDSEHSHPVKLEINLTGEPDYDYNQNGDYVAHWGSWQLIDGELCDFHKHDIDDKAIVLEGGKFLINYHGKYAPNMTFITRKPWIEWEKIDKKDLNLAQGSYEEVKGKYFISKKGAKVLDTTVKNPTHKLIRDAWGGAFNDYRGRSLSEEDAVYYNRARSNGGGSGYDYAVYQINWRNKVSIEDI